MGALLWLEPKKATLQNAAANGDGTVFELGGKYGSVALQISGTFVATVNFEATYDGTNYVAIRGINLNTGNAATSATAPGVYLFSALGIDRFRARISGYTSGTVTAVATVIPAGIPSNQATTTTGTVAIDQATPGTTNGVALTGRGVQAPAVIINAQTAAAGATIYSSNVTVADFSQIGVTVSTDQGYDLIAFAGSGTGGINKAKTADVATAQNATTLTSERYHNVSSIVAGAKDVQFGVKNNGAVSATVTLRWMGHK